MKYKDLQQVKRIFQEDKYKDLPKWAVYLLKNGIGISYNLYLKIRR